MNIYEWELLNCLISENNGEIVLTVFDRNKAEDFHHFYCLGSFSVDHEQALSIKDTRSIFFLDLPDSIN